MKETEQIDAQEERSTLLLKKLKEDLFDIKKDLAGLMNKLTLEVTELENHNASALKRLEQSCSKLRETMQRTLLESQPLMTKLIQESVQKPFDEMKQEVKALSHNLEDVYHVKERKLTTKGVLISLSFCVSSLLTGGSLWYFFPQKVSVAQSLTDTQLKGLRDGALFRHAFKKLSKREQKDLEKKMWDAYDDWFKEFLERT